MNPEVPRGCQVAVADLAALGRLCDRLRQTLQPLIAHGFKSRFAKQATRTLDYWAARPDLIPVEHPTSAASDVHDEARKAWDAALKPMGTRSPDWDWQCNLCFLLDPEDPHHANLLVFTEQDTLRKAITDLPEISPFGFERGHRPAEVSRQEWVRRGRTWKRVLAEGAPSKRGLSLQAHDILADFPTKEEIADLQPGLEGRLQRLAHLRAIDQHIEAKRAAGEITAQSPSHEYMRVMLDYIGEDAHERDIERILPDLRARLKSRYEAADFLARGPEAIRQALGLPGAAGTAG
ncbi:hypothetical protein CKO28_01605 [Rhodovibrio sodomensis]|uniref:HipA-like C-terminal domain-containing protein n=1 Tax=Rhodovibrio sodomensis TaxID=1088 RepID=A0ABS1DA21_9PROT|nr:hypothetical protein [Rhodovibrio sodomensis]MBK1666741.1 hypothetical protein [Rhodovibrio sodomensis]